MPRVIQKKKGFQIDFDFILKVFFTLFAMAILVLVVLKVIERVDNNQTKEVTPILSQSEYGDWFVRNQYEGGFDDFFEDEDFVNANVKNEHDGSVFIFVYNSDLDVYADETNELKDFVTKDYNVSLKDEQSFIALAKKYIEVLNEGENVVIYLLDLYGHSQYIGEKVPGTNLPLAENTLAVCQISFRNDADADDKLDRDKVFNFTASSYGDTYSELSGILGQIAGK